MFAAVGLAKAALSIYRSKVEAADTFAASQLCKQPTGALLHHGGASFCFHVFSAGVEFSLTMSLLENLCAKHTVLTTLVLP